MALIEAMTLDRLEGPEFADGCTDALRAVLEARQEDCQLPEASALAVRPGQLVDLMAVLQESVGKARAARGETGDTDVPEVPEVPAEPAKKTPSQRASSRTAGRAGSRRGTPAR
ncbi:hypothetical protein G9272_44150 [Streptomyces asoensis]|uniref:Uncharacterized protein n=1 Tax=Streptomyces asoensis TaxID=249586 RepID=A0A6M4X0U0_9ACTN|nr:hypothetical protein [Streptomyces asoensis]QJT06427.1 hypothetical protein G9272_44150 [Streptomyces asoensis]